ncbi:unnamed protein product [Heligmosomoides polygyrus]|uniref:Uncharacterized protein n=1 Tax=Heligmosomoides polygyrus TaxID=6339 RepID=A0A183F4J5_HELPZ|nr:unnamed protein product [Heligmosomoides polygyrus]
MTHDRSWRSVRGERGRTGGRGGGAAGWRTADLSPAHSPQEQRIAHKADRRPDNGTSVQSTSATIELEDLRLLADAPSVPRKGALGYGELLPNYQGSVLTIGLHLQLFPVLLYTGSDSCSFCIGVLISQSVVTCFIRGPPAAAVSNRTVAKILAVH